MKIRSISCFIDPASEPFEAVLEKRARFTRAAVQAFDQSGYETQTTRLVTTPFSRWFKSFEPQKVLAQVHDLEKCATENQFSYLAIGFAVPEIPESYALIPTILAETQHTFMGGLMATRQDGISFTGVKACARVIHQAAPLTPDGFANLRFAAVANLPPYGPFFPSAYAGGPEAAFSLAIESADLAINAFQQARSLEEGRSNLLSALQQHAADIETAAQQLASDFNITFKGLDISLAPYPEDWCSMGKALELLGVESVGLSGSLAAAAFIADTLDLGTWKKVGFNGLMLPVLEDSILAQRSIDGTLTVRDLLLFSAVCGAGLDTVPLPGDATIEQLAALLLDVAALANRLGKPLTARLMPVPGKKAGERTGFDFSFFANGSVMDLPAQALSGLLAGSETIQFHPRTYFV
jgi:uncharacterized protein